MALDRIWEQNPIRMVLEREQAVDAALPSLLYITKQQFNRQRQDWLMHSHDMLCELQLVYRGTGIYTVNNKSYHVQAGDILFCNQRDTHELSIAQDGSIYAYCFAFSGVHFRGLPENCIIPQGTQPVRTSGELFQFITLLCEQAYQLLEEDAMGKAAAQCLAISLLFLARRLETSAASQSLTPHNTKMSEDIRDYLDGHYTEKLSLHSIAEQFQCSEPHISHVFKQATGFSPIQYVIRRRNGLAQSYLASTNYTATQIATMVGYDNTNYFNTIFSRMVGMTPIQYRQDYQEKLRRGREPY